jgi:TetR/AcrR family transcriptional regulator, transcriptional repressor for nem operon
MGRVSNADQKLMDAALDLIWEESYGAVTIDQICQRAGVKTGSFYYFFESKADLAVAVFERLWEEEWKPKLDSVFSSSIDPSMTSAPSSEKSCHENVATWSRPSGMRSRKA